MPAKDAGEDGLCEPFHTAIIDLEPGTIDDLKRLGWLDNAQPASQMGVNEACTSLIRSALAEGVTAGSARLHAPESDPRESPPLSRKPGFRLSRAIRRIIQGAKEDV